MRHDLYGLIHKAIRRELSRLLGEIGAADPNAPEETAALPARFDEIAYVLEEHAQHEETHVHPALARCDAELAAQLAAEHIALDGAMTAAKEAIWSGARAPAGERAGALDRAYRQMAIFHSRYLAHMEREDGEAMPALWRACDDAQILGIHGRLMASMSPRAMATFLAVMLPAMRPDERVALLGNIRAGAPPEAFSALMGVARRALDGEAARKLERGLDSQVQA